MTFMQIMTSLVTLESKMSACVYRRVQDMAEDMAEIRKEIVRTRRAQKQPVSTQSVLSSPYMWVIGGTLLAAGSYGCLVYLKPSRGHGGSQLL